MESYSTSTSRKKGERLGAPPFSFKRTDDEVETDEERDQEHTSDPLALTKQEPGEELE